MKRTNNKGFTLIELLVVIAIIAILSVVVILTLNPAELLKQARDSNRISDLSTLKSAISLYLSDVTSPNLATSSTAIPVQGGCTSGTTCYNYCYVSIPSGSTGGPTGNKCAGVGGSGAAYATISGNPAASSTTGNNRKVDGNGWIPLRFTDISSGAPIGNLPVDPTNGNTYFYSYVSTSTLTFEIKAAMESQKYSGASSAANVQNSDGGPDNNAYEVGTVSGLAL